MAQRTGTSTFADLLGNRFQSVAAFGMDNIVPVLQAELAAHNRVSDEMVAELCVVTTDVQRIYGSAVGGTMRRADEVAVTPTQKVKPGSQVAFPLEKFEFPLGWTYEYFLKAKVADVAIMQRNAQIAHVQQIIAEIRRAAYGSANFTSFDALGIPQLDLTIRRWVNADGQAIPAGPNGETYNASTETHFTATATLTNAGVVAAIANVALKAPNAGSIRLAISKTDETAVRGLSGFVAYRDERLDRNTAIASPREVLNIGSPLNRAIGILDAAEVWVKPWAPAGYGLVYDVGTPEKPLAMRVEPEENLRGLRIAAEVPDHPLYARIMEARFGIGVNNRIAGAAYEFGVDTTYTDPAFVAL